MKNSIYVEQEWNDRYSIARFQTVKAIACLFIIYTHGGLAGFPVLFSWLPGGAYWVGCFFFMSGYGFAYSLRHKDHYLDGFLKKKVVEIYIPFVFAECFYIVLSRIITLGGGVNFLLIICQIVGLKLANATLWYVIELLIFYLLSYLLVRRFRLSFVQYAIVCWILFISFFGCSVVFDFGTWWFMSTCSLVLGTTYPVIARSLRRIHSSKPCMVLAVAIFTVLYVFSYHFDVLPERLGHFPKNWIITGVYKMYPIVWTR